MKKISLTKGLFALVDDDDFERLSRFKWRASLVKNKNFPDTYRAVRSAKSPSGKWETVLLHREVLGAPRGKEVDHINHDPWITERKT